MRPIPEIPLKCVYCRRVVCSCVVDGLADMALLCSLIGLVTVLAHA